MQWLSPVKTITPSAYSFIINNITETGEPDDFIPKEYLWVKIEEYCEENKLPKPPSQKKVAYIIKKHLPEVRTAQKVVGNKPGVRVWQYCRFTENADHLKMMDFYDSDNK